MKVLLLSNAKGGVFVFTAELAKGLADEGCDVHIFFLSEGKMAGSMFNRRVHLHRLPSLIFGSKSFRQIFHERPDIIHINFSSYGVLATIIKRVFNVPYIYTIHGLPQPWIEPSLTSKVAYSLEDRFLPYSALNSSAVISPSNYVKTFLAKRYGLDSIVIPHGVNLAKFKPKDRTESRKLLGYNNKNRIILFVGKLHPYKDPLTLIRAASIANKDVEDLHVAMIGSGELRREVEEEIIRLGISRHFRILSRISEEKLRLFYNAADILVFPSINEAFGLVILEALASGLPVIAANTGACPEILGDAGTLFAQGDPVDLAEKIVELMHDEKSLEGHRVRGRKRVEKYFTWRGVVEQYFGIYKRVLVNHLQSH